MYVGVASYTGVILVGAPLMTVIFWKLGVEFVFFAVCGLTALYSSILSPRVAIVLWFLSVCMTPFWAGIRYFAYLPPSTLMGLCVLVGVFWRGRILLNMWDFAVLVLFGFIALLGGLGLSLPGHAFSAITQWLVSYLVGRYLVEQTGHQYVFKLIAAIFGVVACLVIIEFAFQWNPFYATNSGVGQFAEIGNAQERGGIIRAEWAFGHSIALANSLAMAIPVTLVSGFSFRIRLALVGVVAAAGVLTFSRSGILSIGLAVALVMYLGRDYLELKARSMVVVMALAAIGVASPFVMPIFESASQETARSAEHRVAIFDLFPYVNPFGVATGYSETSSGVFNWHGVISIDNAFLRLAINFGYVIAAVILLGLLGMAIAVFRRKANIACVSLVALIPALFTVALITQFGSLVWFYVGMASCLATSRTRLDARITKNRAAAYTASDKQRIGKE